MNRFEQLYQEQGQKSQRNYPNESLIADVAGKFFGLNRDKRESVRILELGCGTGANLWMLADEGFDVTGIDLSPTGLKICEMALQKRGVRVDLVEASMSELPFEEESFDYVFDVVSMQHLNLTSHADTLSEAFRILKPGGGFFSYHLSDQCPVVIQGGESLEWIDESTIANIPEGFPLAGNGPTCFLSQATSRKLLSDAGFRSVQIDRVQRTYNNQDQFIEYLLLRGTK